MDTSTMIYLLKLFGFFPATYKKHEKKFKIKFNDKVYTSMCILFLVIPLSYSLWMCVKYRQSNQKYTLLWCWILVFSYGFLILQYFYQIIKLKKIFLIFEILSLCDNVFKHINWKHVEKKYLYWYYAVLCIIWSSVIIYALSIFCVIEDHEIDIQMHFLYCWYLTYEILLGMQFFTHAFNIWSRLLQLNKFLR